MQFVLPAIILGGAYVTGKVFEFAGEYAKAESFKEAINSLPEITRETCKASMDSLNDFIGGGTI